MAIKMIALSFGHDEDLVAGCLIYRPTNGFPEKRKEALYSLTEFLYKKYLADNPTEIIKECCKKYIGKENYCPKCGKLLTSPKKCQDILDDWKSYVRDLIIKTCDSYGADYEVENPNCWTLWSNGFTLNEKEYIQITEDADKILSIILCKMHPEIFKIKLKDEFHDYEIETLIGLFKE